jgi:hypothetical protein
MADALRKGGLEVYPVEDAAQVVWDAAHGKAAALLRGQAGEADALRRQSHAGRR